MSWDLFFLHIQDISIICLVTKSQLLTPKIGWDMLLWTISNRFKLNKPQRVMYTQKPDSHEADTWLTTDAWLVLSIEDSKRPGTSSHNTHSRYGFLRWHCLTFTCLAERFCPAFWSIPARFRTFLSEHDARALLMAFAASIHSIYTINHLCHIGVLLNKLEKKYKGNVTYVIDGLVILGADAWSACHCDSTELETRSACKETNKKEPDKLHVCARKV